MTLLVYGRLECKTQTQTEAKSHKILINSNFHFQMTEFGTQAEAVGFQVPAFHSTCLGYIELVSCQGFQVCLYADSKL